MRSPAEGTLAAHAADQSQRDARAGFDRVRYRRCRSGHGIGRRRGGRLLRVNRGQHGAKPPRAMEYLPLESGARQHGQISSSSSVHCRVKAIPSGRGAALPALSQTANSRLQNWSVLHGKLNRRRTDLGTDQNLNFGIGGQVRRQNQVDLVETGKSRGQARVKDTTGWTGRTVE